MIDNKKAKIHATIKTIAIKIKRCSAIVIQENPVADSKPPNFAATPRIKDKIPAPTVTETKKPILPLVAK